MPIKCHICRRKRILCSPRNSPSRSLPSRGEQCPAGQQDGGYYIDDEDNYAPEAGDLVFFHHDREDSSKALNYPNRVGIVIRATDSAIRTIEGNHRQA